LRNGCRDLDLAWFAGLRADMGLRFSGGDSLAGWLGDGLVVRQQGGEGTSWPPEVLYENRIASPDTVVAVDCERAEYGTQDMVGVPGLNDQPEFAGAGIELAGADSWAGAIEMNPERVTPPFTAFAVERQLIVFQTGPTGPEPALFA
jgi:hypothetical protein